MKHILLFAAIVLLATSCRKNRKDTTLYGKWRLVTISGMMGKMTAAEWGHSQSFTFEQKGNCTHVYDGATTNVKYKTTTDKSYFSGGDGTFVDIKTYGMYEYRISHDSLMLAGNIAVDGPIEWYVRE